MKALLFFIFVLAICQAAQPVTTLANFPNSVVYAVQTDASGNIYVAGLQGNYTAANPFVVKLSPTGQTLYSTTLAGSNFGIAWAIAVDSSGAAYVFGNTNFKALSPSWARRERSSTALSSGAQRT